MIHYHGGPIWPNEAAVAIWRNRHSMVSFARPEQISIAAEVSRSFCLDNGAFSFWRSGKETEWDKYYQFVEEWYRHPGFEWAVIPDVIDGSVQQNQELINQWPFEKTCGIPVFHLHEPLHWLLFLCESFPRVALGSSGDFAKIGTAKWWRRMADVFSKVTDGTGRPICKIHGLRMLDPKVFTIFPFSSCDSTNVAQNCREKERWNSGPYKPPSNSSRGLVLADRIEAYNSAPAFDMNNIRDCFGVKQVQFPFMQFVEANE